MQRIKECFEASLGNPPTFFGIPLKFGEGDLDMLTTSEGVAKQIEGFPDGSDVGLIYVMGVTESGVEIESFPVKIEF
jgi:hypothetical protein